MTTEQKLTSAPSLTPLMLLLLGAISALTPLAIDMYLPAMPEIARDLLTSSGKVAQTLAAYTAGFAVGQIVYGPISDSYGRRPVLLFGILLFLIGAIGCALAPNIDMLIFIRALQGFSGAAAAVVIQAVVRDMFDKEEFARIMSFITLVMTVAPLAAPMLGGYLSIWFGWRAIFYLLALISILVLTWVYFSISETLAPERRPPLRFSSTIKNFMRILAHRPSVGYIFASAFSFAGLFSFLTAGSFVYIDYYGINPENFSYFFGLNVVFLIVLTTFNGKFVKRFGSEEMLKIGLNIQLFASALLIVGQIFDWGLWGVALPIALFVGTMSMIGSNSTACVLSNYPELIGTATSLAGTLRFSVGTLVGFLLSLVPMSSALPMVGSIVVCGITSAGFYWGLVKRKSE